ncbi:WGR domain-containing protein [Nannocystis pusilla]|uniref:WGR domain-containing protein n=1 Tax=Nannocystis pusilla TaxID=889268 RepID=UPI003B7D0067
MAKYARTEGTITHLWVAERRGRILWTREGKAGAKGRIQSHEHATDEAAAATLATMIAAKERDGYALVDTVSGVSSPFRLPLAAGGRGRNTSGGLDPPSSTAGSPPD